MSSLWQWLVPELRSLPPAERDAALAQARRGRYTSGETLVLVAWMLVVFLFVQQVLRQSTHENKLAFAVVANLVLTAPLMLAVYVPVYLRKVRRHIGTRVADWRRSRGTR